MISGTDEDGIESCLEICRDEIREEVPAGQ